MLPSLSWRGLSEGDDPDAPATEWWNHAPFPALGAQRTWWFFWVEQLLPWIAVATVWLVSVRRKRPWVHEGLKITLTALLAVLINVGFLRGNLTVQVADVVVPAGILSVWLLGVSAALVKTGHAHILGRSIALALPFRALLALVACAATALTIVLVLPELREEIENSSLSAGPAEIIGDAEGTTERLRQVWPLSGWATTDSRGAVQMALYLDACTNPADKVLVTPYLPQTVGLAQRGFAGGVGDLRAGFHDTPAEQDLIIERMQRQSVPVVFGPRAEDWPGFENSLVRVAAYLKTRYRDLGEQQLGEGVVVSLLVDRNAKISGQYSPLPFPCFR